ncbi:MAG: hypothetical protein IJ711_12670, partial [Lachnospiraceae bacterium]|nr:hypothetical protein [Lachnospiraceae bacterium]
FLLRFLLMLFPLMRIVSVLILLTILIKNSYVIILLGFFLCSVGQLTELLPPSLILGICNLNLLGSYDSFQIYGFGSYTCTMYDASLPVSVLAATPIVSLLGAAAALIFGGMYFAGDDLR